MNRIPLVSVLLALAVGAGASCVYEPPARFRDGATATGEPWCPDGSPILVVRNHSGVRLEIIETRSASGGRNTVVAYAGPGTTEISIRRDPDYHYSARPVGGETTAAAETRPRARDRQIDFSRECRT